MMQIYAYLKEVTRLHFLDVVFRRWYPIYYGLYSADDILCAVEPKRDLHNWPLSGSINLFSACVCAQIY